MCGQPPVPQELIPFTVTVTQGSSGSATCGGEECGVVVAGLLSVAKK